MLELYPYLMLWGEQFSPREAEQLTGLALSDKNEPGELGKLGRYKGLPLPYGAAHLVVPTDIPLARRLSWLIDLVALHLRTFQERGASACILHMDVGYSGQCNLEFEPEQLARIAALRIPFTITCYTCLDRDEPPRKLGES